MFVTKQYMLEQLAAQAAAHDEKIAALRNDFLRLFEEFHKEVHADITKRTSFTFIFQKAEGKGFTVEMPHGVGLTELIHIIGERKVMQHLQQRATAQVAGR